MTPMTAGTPTTAAHSSTGVPYKPSPSGPERTKEQGAGRTAWILRAEGAAAGAIATLLFAATDASWWLYAVLLLVPDLAMVGYLRGSNVGALTYNLAHAYVLPLGLAAIGIVGVQPLATSIALIWIAHIGFDRMLGYGLKRPTGFKHTHLGNL